MRETFRVTFRRAQYLERYAQEPPAKVWTPSRKGKPRRRILGVYR